MIKCVNEKCLNNPIDSLHCKVVSIDGDLACNEECKREYEKQKDHFFNVILPNDKKYDLWIRGKDNYA